MAHNVNALSLAEAKALLDRSFREELNDHAFGDSEVYWCDEKDNEIACGYYGSTASVGGGTGHKRWAFEGTDARALRYCGTLRWKERNDTTGPDDYQEGKCMPGLTLAAVFDELTTT